MNLFKFVNDDNKSRKIIKSSILQTIVFLKMVFSLLRKIMALAHKRTTSDSE